MKEIIKTSFPIDEVEEITISELNVLAGNEEAKHEPFVPPTPYEAESRYLTARWEKTGLLANMSEEFKGETAVMLENQRLVNESRTENGDVAQFKRISIPLVRRIMGGSVLRNFASVQPLFGPTGIVYHFKNNKIVSTDIASQARKMKAVWCYEAQQDLRARHNLDAEAELTAILAQELTLEFDRTAVTNMMNNAALKKEVNFEHMIGETIQAKWGTIQDMVFDLAVESQDLYHRPFPNWIVTHREMCAAICPKVDKNDAWMNGYGISMNRWGSLSTDQGNITVWNDPLFPHGKIMLGYKGEHKYDAGYIFAPYILLGQTPVVLDPDTFIPRRGIISRYGQKLVDPTYYATLHVKGFISEEQWENKQAMDNGTSCR